MHKQITTTTKKSSSHAKQHVVDNNSKKGQTNRSRTQSFFSGRSGSQHSMGATVKEKIETNNRGKGIISHGQQLNNRHGNNANGDKTQQQEEDLEENHDKDEPENVEWLKEEKPSGQWWRGKAPNSKT